MAKIPSPLDRRHLLERELSADQAIAIADAYLEQGRGPDAVDFLRKAGADDRLEALAEQAIEAGDLFLLNAVARAGGEEPAPAQLERLAASARSLGKTAYAESAERLAHRGEDG